MSRYVVTSITGYPAQGTKCMTSWYVLDRDYCYRQVAAFAKRGGNQRRYVQQFGNPEKRALELAAELNEKDELEMQVV